MPGLAHLCEHLLHRKAEFFSYVRECKGLCNAFTLASDTIYYFSIGEDIYFETAIEGFANFFCDPAFKEGSVKSERQAVHAEYLSNLQSDFFRLTQLFKYGALKNHPWSRFGIGNEATLKSVTAEKLTEWWEHHYSPSIMGLVIVGRQPLYDLVKMVRKNFSFGPFSQKSSHVPTTPWGIPHHVPTTPWGIPHHVPTTPWVIQHVSTIEVSPYLPDQDKFYKSKPTTCHAATTPWGIHQQGNITFAKTVQDVSTIEVSFCLPDQDKFYESKPTIYVSRIISQQGPGSLDSYLKQKGWITWLSCDPYQPARGFSFFPIKATLTQSGLGKQDDMLLIPG
jgi:insulysin